MPTSDLQIRFLTFAKGMPALAFGKSMLVRELEATRRQLAGAYPDAPAPSMGDIPLPVYRLAFSVFLDDLTVRFAGDHVVLDVALRATIHPRGKPADIIRIYDIRNAEPVRLKLDYASSDRLLTWVQDGMFVPTILPAWGANADDILAASDLPAPQDESFQKEVETPILWSTGSTFVNLVVDLLPKYDLGELCPWLTLIEPALFDYDGEHAIVTASRAKLEIGGCSPISTIVEPDPAFPYGQAIGKPDTASRSELAVYLPKTRIIDFVAGSVDPAIMVDSGQHGGIIKWRATGSFGLESFQADVSGGIVNGSPFGGGGLTVKGVLTVDTRIDFVGVAKAWVNGPSGTKIGLASANVIGDGRLAADIAATFDGASGVLSAAMTVTHASINPDFDVHTPLGWPIDDIAGAVLDRVAKNEIKKLTGQVSKLGTWDIMDVPQWFRDFLQGAEPYPILEGYQGVAVHFGVGSMKG